MQINGTTLIRRPIDVVFAYVDDVSNDRNWRNGLDESRIAEGEQLGLGTVGTSRAGDTEVQWRVEVYEPGQRIEWKLLSGPFSGRGGYLLEPAENGTRFTLLADIEPSGLYKLLGPLFGWLGRRRNQSDVEKLRHILEAGHEANRRGSTSSGAAARR